MSQALGALDRQLHQNALIGAREGRARVSNFLNAGNDVKSGASRIATRTPLT
jgi:hypothetical protein